jgi:hypothetical protein
MLNICNGKQLKIYIRPPITRLILICGALENIPQKNAMHAPITAKKKANNIAIPDHSNTFCCLAYSPAVTYGIENAAITYDAYNKMTIPI